MTGNAQKAPRPAPWSTAVAEMLLDRIAQGVLAVSPEGKVTYANLTMAAMLGCQRSAVIGGALLEIAAEADRPKVFIALGAGRERVTHQRVALQRPDDGELPVHLTFAPLPRAQASCIVSDLSDRKRRDESAERSSRLLLTLAHELRSMVAPLQGCLDILEAEQASEGGRRAVESMQHQCARMLALAEDLRNINEG